MSEPQDRRVDRRAFLARTAALGVAGTVALPPIAEAAPVAVSGPADVEVQPRPEAMADPTELTIAEAATLIRSGRLRPETLLRAYLDRIRAFDGIYQAFNTVRPEGSATASRGPLRGIVLAIKDNYFTAGLPTTANSFLYADFVPPYDATAVARLKTAGAVVLGKTQMGPLATTRATTPDGRVTTVSAWAPDRPEIDPGGSSTGTATAVAARMATSGTGTQTGGSITSPCNAQNLTGLKPTMGRVSLHGIIPLSYTRDHPGPLARDALDAAIMLSAMAGPDPHDPRTQGLPRVPDLITAAKPVRQGRRVRLRWPTRIGVIPGYLSGSSPTAQARAAFLDTLAGVPGVTLVDVPLPDEWALLTGGAFNNVRLPERAEAFAPQLTADLRGFGVSVLGWLQGAVFGAQEYLVGQRAKVVLTDRVLTDLFARCDVVVQTSPLPFDIIGLPELALPIGFTPEGLPIGTILGGLPFAEDRLLSIAAAYQALTTWHRRRPADPVVGAAVAARPRLTALDVLETMQ
ncbi:amidase [Actinophytocola sp.]|uniref:amidase n=1 Tax=Actinophytocola sp. TaxID=1872138 RepID=UPI002D80BAF8|nr:amidase [Actinophytocola sp.]HET9141722.1 amidase [Actinophytocola sp.]